MPLRRILQTFALIVGLGVFAACGGNETIVGADSRAIGAAYSFGTDGVPPEFHESAKLTIEGTTFQAVRLEQYGEVVISDISFELRADQLNDFADLVSSADLRQVDQVKDECTGTQTILVRLSFDDGSEAALFQDTRTYGGESGRCKNFNTTGDLASIVNFLLDLEALG